MYIYIFLEVCDPEGNGGGNGYPKKMTVLREGKYFTITPNGALWRPFLNKCSMANRISQAMWEMETGIAITTIMVFAYKE